MSHSAINAYQIGTVKNSLQINFSVKSHLRHAKISVELRKFKYAMNKQHSSIVLVKDFTDQKNASSIVILFNRMVSARKHGKATAVGMRLLINREKTSHQMLDAITIQLKFR